MFYNQYILHRTKWNKATRFKENLSSPSASCFSVTKSCPTLCNPMDCGMSGSSVPHYLLEFAQIHVQWESVMLSNHLILCCPLLLLLSIFPSIFPIREPTELQHQSSQWIFCCPLLLRLSIFPSIFPIREPQYRSFSISPPNEYSGLISLGGFLLFLTVGS